MTRQQLADDLIARKCKVADVYNKSMLNNVHIESFYASLRRCLRNNWLTKPLPNLIHIAFPAEFKLSIQKEPKNAAASNFLSAKLERTNRRKLWHTRKTVRNVNKDIRSSPARSFQRQSKFPPFLQIQSSGTSTKIPRSIPTSSSSMPSVNPSFCKVCYNGNHVKPKCLRLSHPSLAQLAVRQ